MQPTPLPLSPPVHSAAGSALTVGAFLRAHRTAVLATLVGFAVLFFPTAAGLATAAWEDDDFSHCLLVPFVSGAILLSRRRSIAACSIGKHTLGVAALAVALVLFAVGRATNINVFQRVGMLGAIVAWILALLGGSVVWNNRFPFFFLVMAVPLPFDVYSQLSIRLRDLATRLSAGMLQVTGIPVFNDGNLLHVGDEDLKVADACSGIRSLLAIISVALLLGYLMEAGLVKGAIVAAVAVPVTLAVNAFRIYITAVALHSWEIDLREGTLHECMGFLTFALSLCLLWAAWWGVEWVARGRPSRAGGEERSSP